jgi:hypothetical protein
MALQHCRCIPAPKGAVCESPARQCRVEVELQKESRRDGTNSHANATFLLEWTSAARTKLVNIFTRSHFECQSRLSQG